ncbi:MAG: hypothetical protein OHK0039_12900 [Bacteroidia bacterium]
MNIHPRIGSGVLLLIYVVVLLRPLMPVLEYQLRYDYIREVLCINRERPQLNCDGKCYLMQQMQEAARPEEMQRLPVASLKYELLVVFGAATYALPDCCEALLLTRCRPADDVAATQHILETLVPPPRA